MFIFGLTAQQVEARKRAGDFGATAAIAASNRLNDVLQAIRSGVFSPDDPSRYTGDRWAGGLTASWYVPISMPTGMPSSASRTCGTRRSNGGAWRC